VRNDAIARAPESNLVNATVAGPVSRSQALAGSLYRPWVIVITLVIQSAVVVLTRPNDGHWGFHGDVAPAIRSHHFAIIATLLALAASVCSYFLSRLVVVRAPVFNTSNPLVLSVRVLPNFVQQDRNSESLHQFRGYMDEILGKEYFDSFSKAVAMRQWVRQQQSQDANTWRPERRDHENPHRLLEEQKKGMPGSCRRFSYILLGALLSAGFDARLVYFTGSLHRHSAEGHVGVEVWIEELTKWVFLDPTCDTAVQVQGRFASATELYDAVMDGRLDEIAFDRGGGTLWPHPKTEFYARCCRHLFVAMSNAVFDGYAVRMVGPKRISFLHYSKEAAYPTLRKRLLLGAGATLLFLSAVFWVWTVASIINNTAWVASRGF